MKNFTHRIGMQSLVISGLCLSLLGCSESFDTSFFEKEINDPSLAVGLKIGYSEYTATELFEEIGDDIEVGTTDDNGKSLVSFTYTESLNSANNSDFVSVDDQSFEGDFDLLASSGLVGQAPYVTGTVAGDEVQDSFKDIKSLTLDSDLTAADFSAGTFTITLETTTEAQTVVEFTIPSFKRKPVIGTGSYNRTFTLNNNSGADEASITVDLNNYDLDFTYDALDPDSNTGVNNVAVLLDATVTFENGDIVSSTDNLKYTITLTNSKVKTAKGDFKDASFNVDSQTFDLDFFKEIGEGNITFENPILKLTANSGYGFPIGLTLEDIKSSKPDPNDANAEILTNLIITDATPLDDNIEPITGGTGNYAIIDDAATNGETKESIIILNKDNSNLDDLLNGKPTKFKLDVTAGANPNSTTVNTNFFDVANTLAVDVVVELPLYVTFENLTFSPDPFEFDSEDIEDIEENVSSLSLNVHTKNSIPLSGTVTLDFLESNGNIAFSKPASLMNAAPVDANGLSTYIIDANGDLKEGTTVVKPTETIVDFTKEEISALTNVTDIQAVIKFNTTNSAAAKIQSTDKVRLDLSLIGDFTVSEDEDDDNN
ncbi:hypothetical protein FHR24_002599 [Wenyingzhuangia heitensis]|uniref:Uncharacterized protein n=1 Tax=Wenyingzhuangia heitensis TaxID=1487859 RepID=A0ABX0UFB2_9FLAO|nr:hypothetical protein [Wenyingzhuangia heitensis]NIJ46121.1 hypothetical protein [Wenyingzhuangia heitensis]